MKAASFSPLGRGAWIDRQYCGDGGAQVFFGGAHEQRRRDFAEFRFKRVDSCRIVVEKRKTGHQVGTTEASELGHRIIEIGPNFDDAPIQHFWVYGLGGQTTDDG